MKTLRGKVGLYVSTISMFCILSAVQVFACAHEEVMSSDFSGYDLQDVERILTEDLTVPSELSLEQKSACLIGDMKSFTEEFDKRCGNIKFEALTAISAVETGYFSSDICKEYNNVGGICVSGEYLCYDSKAEGIQALSDLLNDCYLNPNGVYYEGNTIIDISQHYNQSVHWVNLYVKVRLDMEERYERIRERQVEPLCSKIYREVLKPDWVYTRSRENHIKLVEGLLLCQTPCENLLPKNLVPINTSEKFSCEKKESKEV